MFIPNHHEGYISLAAFERIQRQIRENATMKCPLSQGPVRRGKGLVAGLLRCRRCGRKLHVTYSGIRGNVVRYHCRGAAVNHGTDKCISFGGTAVDREVEREVLKALDPESIRAAIVQMDRVQDRRNDQRRALELALRQAEYETQRAFRQYNAVEPENRLVTRELERRWNEALAEEVRLQGQLAQIPEEPGQLAEADRELLMALARDFPRVWHSDDTELAQKKRLVRLLIQEIMVDVDEEKARVNMVILWSGGCHTQLNVKKNRTGQHRRSTDRETVELVRELARVSGDVDIARILNRLNVRTGTGRTWTEPRVRSLRNYHQIPAYSPETKLHQGWLNLREAADYLGISPMSVRRLLEDGRLKGQQAVPYAPWIIRREDLDLPETRQLAAQIAGRDTHKARRTVSGQASLEL